MWPPTRFLFRADNGRPTSFFGALRTDVVERVVAAVAADRAVGLVDRVDVDEVDVDEEEKDMMLQQ